MPISLGVWIGNHSFRFLCGLKTNQTNKINYGILIAILLLGFHFVTSEIDLFIERGHRWAPHERTCTKPNTPKQKKVKKKKRKEKSVTAATRTQEEATVSPTIIEQLHAIAQIQHQHKILMGGSPVLVLFWDPPSPGLEASGMFLRLDNTKQLL